MKRNSYAYFVMVKGKKRFGGCLFATSMEKAWGIAWVESAHNAERARLWIDNNLNKVTTERRTPFNCYNVYARKDERPLTEDDIAAVRFLSLGQCNVFTLSEDGMNIAHHWECDSSD